MNQVEDQLNHFSSHLTCLPTLGDECKVKTRRCAELSGFNDIGLFEIKNYQELKLKSKNKVSSKTQTGLNAPDSAAKTHSVNPSTIATKRDSTVDSIPSRKMRLEPLPALCQRPVVPSLGGAITRLLSQVEAGERDKLRTTR